VQDYRVFVNLTLSLQTKLFGLKRKKLCV